MAHHNTVFAQMLKLIPSHEFESLAYQHHTGRGLRKMTRWPQFVAMASAQLSGRHSLRDVVSNMAAQARKRYHLGMSAVNRSSLSRVNASQPYALYEALFAKLPARCQASCSLDHEGLLPALVAMTENKTHELSAARALRLPKGSIVVMDRGYNDDVWYNQLNNNDISFVTRLKTNARYRVIERHTVLKTRGLTCAQAIELTGARAKHCPIRLRRIGYKDAATGIHYGCLNHKLKLAASTIADSYKACWQSELCFKWSKQNLKVKRFLGVSKNAVLTQIGIAMCVYLLLSCIRFLYKIQPSLQQWFQLLQLNLFERRDLLELLKGDPPEHRISPHQTTLLFS